jgi:uncharacterized membrane protein
MNEQEIAIVVWSVFFVVSGIVFILGFMFSPFLGVVITAGYILAYIGISAAFIVVFREMESVKTDSVAKLRERVEELEEIKKAVRGKFYKKDIDAQTFRRITQDYEKRITELEVKINRMLKKK